MSRFRGQFVHTLDKKGRISIPVRFREILRHRYDDQLVLAPSDNCLKAYPVEEWERLEENVLKFPRFSKVVKDYQRLFLSAGQDCPIDPQGRILIPPELRARASLKDKVLFVSMLEHFEIWNRDVYMQRYEQLMDKISDIEDELAQMAEKQGI